LEVAEPNLRARPFNPARTTPRVPEPAQELLEFGPFPKERPVVLEHLADGPRIGSAIAADR